MPIHHCLHIYIKFNFSSDVFKWPYIIFFVFVVMQIIFFFFDFRLVTHFFPYSNGHFSLEPQKMHNKICNLMEIGGFVPTCPSRLLSWLFVHIRSDCVLNKFSSNSWIPNMEHGTIFYEWIEVSFFFLKYCKYFFKKKMVLYLIVS